MNPPWSLAWVLIQVDLRGLRRPARKLDPEGSLSRASHALDFTFGVSILAEACYDPGLRSHPASRGDAIPEHHASHGVWLLFDVRGMQVATNTGLPYPTVLHLQTFSAS